jgi:hypothetical protein
MGDRTTRTEEGTMHAMIIQAIAGERVKDMYASAEAARLARQARRSRRTQRGLGAGVLRRWRAILAPKRSSAAAANTRVRASTAAGCLTEH